MVFTIDDGIGVGFQGKTKPKGSAAYGRQGGGSFVDDAVNAPLKPAVKKPSKPSKPAQPPGLPTYPGGTTGNTGGVSAPANPLAGLDLDEISAALAAISGMFELQRGSLTVEQENAMSAFNMLSQRIENARATAVDETRGAAAGRGLLRSGLYLNAVEDIASNASDQQSQALSERVARERAIQQQISGLTSQEKMERANRARELARQQVGTKEAIAAALELV